MNKIKSYIGFAIKSKQVVYGADNILVSKKNKLIVASIQLSQNTLEKLKNINVKIITLPHEIFEDLNIKGLVVSITNLSLAKAIIENL